jgi:hypothetical protein
MKFQSLNMKVYIFAWTMEPTCDLEYQLDAAENI